MKKTVEAHREDHGELGLTGFIFGIFGIIFAGQLGIIISLLGLIFSVAQRRKKPTKWSKLGIILSIIGLVLSIFFIIFLLPIYEEIINSFPNT